MNIKLVVMVCTAMLALAGAAPLRSQTNPPPTKMSAAEFQRFIEENNNWGRWGQDDVLGTINLITEQKRRQAAALVERGISVSVAHDLSTEEALDNPRPLTRDLTLRTDTRSDTFLFQYHGTFVTHLDALCHYAFGNQAYNGIPLTDECVPGVDNLKNGIVTRGVLIDIPRLKGLPYLEPDVAIFQSDIEAWEEMTGIRISPGDAVILRTGRWARRAARGPWNALTNAAGFDVTVAPWFQARGVALAGGDVTVEIHTDPPVVEGEAVPLHRFLIAGLGMPIIDDLDPEALAEICARLNRWEFMLVVAPLRVPNGTGSPVNPIAIL